MDKIRFEQEKAKIIGKDRQRLQIGTLSEKTVHAVVKNYYEPDEDKQEIPIEGMYADIFTGNEIIEIQTRSFDQVRKKLDRFLPEYHVVFDIDAFFHSDTIIQIIPNRKYRQPLTSVL